MLRRPESDYLPTVERFFLQIKASGMTLSANDYHLIRGWEAQGVPVEVLCRAIERGAEHCRAGRRGGRALSLVYMKPFIEEVLARERGKR